MPRKALTRRRAARDNVITSNTAKERELAQLIAERPDKPILIRVRTWFLEKIEAEKDEIFANFKDVMSGRASAAMKDIEILIHDLKSVDEKDHATRRMLIQAINTLADTAKMQQSRERILSKMLDKILVDTREADQQPHGPDGLFRGANISMTFGNGIKRGTAVDDAKDVTPAVVQ